MRNELVCLEGEKNGEASGGCEGRIVAIEIEEAEVTEPACKGLVSLEGVPPVSEREEPVTERSPEGITLMTVRDVDEDSVQCINRFEVMSEGNEDVEQEMGKDFESDPSSRVAVQDNKKIKGGTVRKSQRTKAQPQKLSL